MHVQIVTFNLDGMSEDEYIDVASQLAPRFSALPGLLAKVWLENPESGVYGAIYLWEDEETMDRFMATNLFEGTNRAFGNLVSEDFSVLENLTRATQPVLTLLEDSRAWSTAAVAPAARRTPRASTPRRTVTPPAPATDAPAAKTSGGAKRSGGAKKAKVTKVSTPGKAAPKGAGTGDAGSPSKTRSRPRKATS